MPVGACTPSSSSSTTPGSTPRFNPCQSPNIIFSRPHTPTPYMRSLLTYVDAVNAGDFEKMASVFDEALEHRILPKSLGRPVLTKRQYGEYWKGVMSLFERFETKVTEVIEAGEKMTVHASSSGTSVSGTPYSNEYVLMIHFTSPPEDDPYDTLPKILYLKEFVDSGFSARFFKEERERQRRRRKREEEEWNGMCMPGVS